MFIFSLWTKPREPVAVPSNADDTMALITSNEKAYSTISPEQPESPADPIDCMLTTHPLPDDEADDEINEAPNDAPSMYPLLKRLWAFYAANNFLILIICAILMAYVYPPLGAVYLAPQITATWIAVVFIFSTCFIGYSCL